MSIFKNPNESAYVGGRKHWTDVIKNSGPGDLLLWRQPEEDFNTNSTLIVMPGESAFFINEGRVEEVFENGTYKLTTENYPFISRLRNMFSGGISTFNCVVYFVRTAVSMEIFWGTSSPIQVRDKLLGIATKIKARGSYKVKVVDPVIFLEKLVGNNIQSKSQEDLNFFFMNEFQSKIRSVLTEFLSNSESELLGIEAHLSEFSSILEPSIDGMLSEYGLQCARFAISALEVDDNELRRRYDEIGMDAIGKLRGAQADAGVMDILGDNWARLQAAGILNNLASNPGAGGTAAAGAGIGMGIAAGGVFNGLAGQMFSSMTPSGQQSQSASVSQFSRFAPRQEQPGQSSPAAEDPVAVLKKLKVMLDSDLITQAEYDAKKDEILKRM